METVTVIFISMFKNQQFFHDCERYFSFYFKPVAVKFSRNRVNNRIFLG